MSWPPSTATPSLLDGPNTVDVLAATVDHLEADQGRPWRLDIVPDYVRRIAPTTGFRLRAGHRLVQVTQWKEPREWET
ncbi:MAG: hypothetical protein ACR2KJ_13195 [Jatrophihabitans sp.]